MLLVVSASQAAGESGNMLLVTRQDQSFVPTSGGSVECNPPNNGEDPTTCARDNGIALPDKFLTPAAPTTTSPPTDIDETPVVPPAPPAPITTPPFVSTPAGNATVPASTGSVPPGGTARPIEPFTGAAARLAGLGGVFLGIMVGATGWVA
ncbi:MAG: hypothetical protein LQ337_003080 [Flavoplaca oasis]|nr:MAG: hypothetical protein LQ337_003080 [Flavoplaca oasis]